MEFLGNLWDSYQNATVADRFSFWPTLGWYVGITAAAFSFFTGMRFRTNRKRLEALRMEISAIDSERIIAERKAQEAIRKLEEDSPSQWLIRAEKELSQNNEELAIERLTQNFGRLSNPLSKVAVLLARDQFARVIGSQPHESLAESLRFAKIAALLDPDSAAIEDLVQEIESLQSSADFGAMEVPFLPTDPQKAIAVISYCQEFGAMLVSVGHMELASIIYRRARLAASRSGLKFTRPDFQTEYCICRWHLFMGQSQIGLDLVNKNISLIKSNLNDDLELLGDFEFARADFLTSLGQARESLAVLKDLLPQTSSLKGHEHPDTLACFFLQARNTYNIGMPEEALRLIRELLPRHERVLGPDDPNVLASRQLEAYAVTSIEGASAALPLIESLIAKYEKTVGLRSPHAIPTRTLFIQVQSAIGHTGKSKSHYQSMIVDLRETVGNDSDLFRDLKEIGLGLGYENADPGTDN